MCRLLIDGGYSKKLSAYQYSGWKNLKSYYDANLFSMCENPGLVVIPDGLVECDTIMETASATNTPTRIEKLILSNAYTLKFMKDFAVTKKIDSHRFHTEDERLSETKLVIIDEVDHLKYTSLEQLRTLYDRFGFGMVLIGMPGIERRFSRYPKLYSRVGFLHEFKALSKDEMTFIIEHHLQQLGTKISMDTLCKNIRHLIRKFTARVSTKEQTLSMQVEALKEAGCTIVHEEVASGAKTARVVLPANHFGLSL